MKKMHIQKPYKNMNRARVDGSPSFSSYVGNLPTESTEDEYGGGITYRERDDFCAPKKFAS